MKLDFNKKEYDYFIENAGFTDKEIEILDHVRKGRYYKEFTEEVGLCEKSIGNKVRSIKKKILKCIKDS